MLYYFFKIKKSLELHKNKFLHTKNVCRNING